VLAPGEAEPELERALQGPVGSIRTSQSLLLMWSLVVTGRRHRGGSGKMVFQFAKVAEVLAASGTAELSQSGGTAWIASAAFTDSGASVNPLRVLP